MSSGINSINVTSVYEVKMDSSKNNQITLRALTIDDIDAFMTWGSDDDVTKSLMWESYRSKEDAVAFFKNVVEKHSWFKAICLDGQVIGSITLERGKGAHSCKAELGYVIAKSFWSKGYTTRAIKEAIKSGFNDLNIARIEAFVDPENIASIKALEKAGFQCEGLLKKCVIQKNVVKDRYLYALTNV